MQQFIHTQLLVIVPKQIVEAKDRIKRKTTRLLTAQEAFKKQYPIIIHSLLLDKICLKSIYVHTETIRTPTLAASDNGTLPLVILSNIASKIELEFSKFSGTVGNVDLQLSNVYFPCPISIEIFKRLLPSIADVQLGFSDKRKKAFDTTLLEKQKDLSLEIGFKIDKTNGIIFNFKQELYLNNSKVSLLGVTRLFK